MLCWVIVTVFLFRIVSTKRIKLVYCLKEWEKNKLLLQLYNRANIPLLKDRHSTTNLSSYPNIWPHNKTNSSPYPTLFR